MTPNRPQKILLAMLVAMAIIAGGAGALAPPPAAAIVTQGGGCTIWDSFGCDQTYADNPTGSEEPWGGDPWGGYDPWGGSSSGYGCDASPDICADLDYGPGLGETNLSPPWEEKIEEETIEYFNEGQPPEEITVIVSP
jgi:hypothetical protein